MDAHVGAKELDLQYMKVKHLFVMRTIFQYYFYLFSRFISFDENTP